tara:strand:- start:919 stop:2130 length:1212 start_codon:yes stop_codon:yes gene_type:complete
MIKQVLLFVIVGAIFLFFRQRKTSYIKDGVSLDKIEHTAYNVISKDIRPPIIENNISYSFWIYLKEFYYNFSKWKHIFHKGTNIENKQLDYSYWENIENEIPEQSIGVWMHPYTNNLRICAKTDANVIEYTDIEDISQNEGVHLSISISNKTLNVYINNKLTTTKIFGNRISINTKPMYFNFPYSFNGTIYNFLYLPRIPEKKLLTQLFNNKPPLNQNTTIIKNKFLDKRLDITTTKFISNIKLPPSEVGIKFTYSLWLYIRNIPENALWNTSYKYKKNIIAKYGSPNIKYIPFSNTLVFEISYRDTNDEVTIYDINVENIKIQKWNHVVITLDGRYTNIFIDGKLIKHILIPSVPFIYNKNLFIGDKENDFNGYISTAVYYNTAISYKEVLTLYNKDKNTGF